MQLTERIRSVESRVEEACRRSGRSRDEVRIIAVSKYVSVETADRAVDSGLIHLGENRWQTAKPKVEVLGDRAVWHFIGHLQTNKVKEILGAFEYVHSLDRLSLAKELSIKASALGLTVTCFIQVNVSGEETKYGLDPAELFSFCREIQGLPALRIAGLMTMAPHEEDPERTRPVFRKLRELRDKLNQEAIFPYSVDGLSMGMSGDFEIAVEEGATWLRLGSVLLPNDDKGGTD